jgi:hypothetical protein
MHNGAYVRHPEEREATMAPIRRVMGVALALIVLIAVFLGGWIVGRTGIGSVVADDALKDAERQFVERMKDVSLVGTRSKAGKTGRRDPTATTSRASRKSATISGVSTPA